MKKAKIVSALLGWGIPSLRPLKKWIVTYEEELRSRNYKPKTIADKISMMKRFSECFGNASICDIRPKDIHRFIKQFSDKGQYSTAKNARVLLTDMFREAVLQEWIKTNPAIHVGIQRVPVARARLLYEEWLRIYNAAVFCAPYVRHSMLLSLVTAQRRADISKMRRADIYDDHLHVVQQKTDKKLAIPLSLYCEPVGMTLRDVVNNCPGSDFLLGERQVMPWSLSQGFKTARDIAYPDDKWDFPPTMHEQRSLAERIYRDQGVNTLRLLGHQSQSMTDKYNDNRQREFQRLVI